MRGAAVAVGTAALLVLSGCSGSTDAPLSSSTPDLPSVPAPTVTPTPTRLPLADLAESAAATIAPPKVTATPLGDLVEGADVSWPQCSGTGLPPADTQVNPMPVPTARFVVLGLTHGPGFTANPCLAAQVGWVRDRGLLVSAYSIISYPDRATLRERGAEGPYDRDTELGRLANVGYQQAGFNLATMVSAGLQSPIVWIDIEDTDDSPGWSPDITANAAVVTGMVQGYRDAGRQVGVYSTPALYAGIVGALTLDVVEWRASGPGTRRSALVRCGEDWSVQGGEVVMTQWVAQRRDHNVTCPGTSSRLGEWFHQY